MYNNEDMQTFGELFSRDTKHLNQNKFRLTLQKPNTPNYKVEIRVSKFWNWYEYRCGHGSWYVLTNKLILLRHCFVKQTRMNLLGLSKRGWWGDEVYFLLVSWQLSQVNFILLSGQKVHWMWPLSCTVFYRRPLSCWRRDDFGIWQELNHPTLLSLRYSSLLHDVWINW